MEVYYFLTFAGECPWTQGQGISSKWRDTNDVLQHRAWPRVTHEWSQEEVGGSHPKIWSNHWTDRRNVGDKGMWIQLKSVICLLCSIS